MAWKTTKIIVYERDAEELQKVADACDQCVEDLVNDLIANFLWEQAELNDINKERYFNLVED